MNPKRTFEKVIVHCSDTPDDSPTVFDVHDIRRWHKRRGWSDCGYHWVVTRAGEVQAGRPEKLIGAHCRGQNYSSIGVCLVGREAFEKVQLERIRDIFFRIKKDYKIDTPDWYCHNEFTTGKTCPGFSGGFLRDWLLQAIE